MKESLTKEETLRRYLVGDMLDEERESLEVRFINDDALFEELRAVEDELYVEYAAGELEDSEKTAFEKKFLRTREDRKRLAFADAFLDITNDMAGGFRPLSDTADERRSFFGSIAAFLRLSGSALQVGMAAAVLLMAVGMAFLVIQNRGLRNNVAQFDAEQQLQKQELDRQIAEREAREAELQRQLTEERDRGQQDQQTLAEIEAERSKLRGEIEDARRRSQQLKVPPSRVPGDSGPGRSVIALVLSPGNFVRGANNPEASRIVLTPSTKQVKLNLSVKDGNDYTAYRVVVSNVDDGKSVLSTGDLKERRKRIIVALPATTLPLGDYEVSLSGITAGGKTEEVTRYYFSVVR